jgi:hypothetical protein
MRWIQAAMGVLALMMATGCPSEFGKDGRVAKAARRDSLELVQKRCGAPELWAACEGPNKSPEECRKCGG